MTGKAENLNVRLSPAEKRALRTRMKAAGAENLSEYVRGIIRRHLRAKRRRRQ
jgi:hypothetical protein